jgi:hypothetical protein
VIWRAVAVNHWVTRTRTGMPVSVKLWRDGWVLGCRFARQPATLFGSLREVISYLESGRLV